MSSVSSYEYTPDHDEDRPDRSRAKRVLRRLDGCLDELEKAHEHNSMFVTAAAAATIGAHVPAVSAGMLIVDAIELVLREQEQYLIRDVRDPVPYPSRIGLTVEKPANAQPPASGDQGARALTERIRRATRHVCLLLLEAHERRVWLALGYRSWEQYVRQEFGFSRTRSYELLDQGRIVLAIKSAASLTDLPDISPYAALQLKHHLGEVVSVIRERTAGLPEQRAMAIVGEVIDERRAWVVRDDRRLRPRHVEAEDSEAIDIVLLRRAVELLARMPPAAEAVAFASADRTPLLASVERAIRWLTEFAQESRRRV
jgi:hypothetical protein